MSILDPLLFITIFNDKVFLDPSFTNNMFLYVDNILLLKAMILGFMRLSLSHRCFHDDRWVAPSYTWGDK